MATTNLQVTQSAQDLVAILDSDTLQPLFADANPMQMTVRETSKIMSVPVEDGTLRSDHIVYDPVEIDLPLLLTDDVRTLYQNLRNAWKTQTLLTIQGKLSTYPGMMIYDMPHDETVEQGNSVTIAVKMRHVEIVKPEYGTLPPSKVANKSQASTVKKGTQQTTESSAATKKKTSILGGFNVLDKIEKVNNAL